MGCVNKNKIEGKMDMTLEELAKIKYVFFDVDGVLSVPRYKNFDKEEYVSGFTDENWLKFDIFSEHPYKDCIAPKTMKKFVHVLHKNRGICKKIFCLTVDDNSFSYNSKKRFIKEHYPEIKEENMILVASTGMKKDVIRYIAEKDNINVKECLLIEDTFQTIIDAELAGISNLHVAGIPDLVTEIMDYRIATRPRNYDIIYDEMRKLF